MKLFPSHLHDILVRNKCSIHTYIPRPSNAWTKDKGIGFFWPTPPCWINFKNNIWSKNLHQIASRLTGRFARQTPSMIDSSQAVNCCKPIGWSAPLATPPAAGPRKAVSSRVEWEESGLDTSLCGNSIASFNSNNNIEYFKVAACNNK